MPVACPFTALSLFLELATFCWISSGVRLYGVIGGACIGTSFDMTLKNNLILKSVYGSTGETPVGTSIIVRDPATAPDETAPVSVNLMVSPASAFFP